MKTIWRKIKKHILSYIDIASLKYIVRKLFKAKLTQEKEYNVMLSCQMAL
jgi:transcriptional regulator CtsR